CQMKVLAADQSWTTVHFAVVSSIQKRNSGKVEQLAVAPVTVIAAPVGAGLPECPIVPVLLVTVQEVAIVGVAHGNRRRFWFRSTEPPAPATIAWPEPNRTAARIVAKVVRFDWTHVLPSTVTITVPPPPVAMHVLAFVQLTPSRLSWVLTPEVCPLQLLPPSVVTRIAPPAPTA